MRKRLKWKIHQCSICEVWTADGRMHQAGYGKHLLHKFICSDCRQDNSNERRLLLALSQWELDHEPNDTRTLL
jgi:hypothetical protein